ncbi:MAG: molybdenum cofactor biosysynthesis protein [Opitutaceae bacterium]
MKASDRVQLVSGKGIVGDRYFDRSPGHKGQVTFFAEEIWTRLCREFARFDLGPAVFRRNILVRNADLLSLVGAEFEIQGIRFKGTEHCKPCFWMDHAFAPGAFAALSSWMAGGLRACVLSDGFLSTV